ncbi:unnamed protein product [Candidula unifasciata]|uniref:Tubulin--tyrosine ligase-like protein 5 n=1 Tax=Candidula unifasciata TaxID=100452 RepID=A0A8S4A5A8_9EUPU|nr:unnamed protein product [Candidula unifasciata]
MPLKSERECASSCSVTPSEHSNRDEDASDSDYESDHGEDRFDHLGKLMNIRWIGPGRTLPILAFDTKGFFGADPSLKNVGVQNNLACKVTGDSQILREILTAHGFREVGMLQRRYNLAWTGRHTKPSYVRKMAYCHVINHFPGTEELTRKDKLYKNIIRMQETKGKEHFDFVPVSFKLPTEYRSLRSHYKKERGLYIVKPVSLSRGRGVFVIDNPKKINSIHVEGPGDYRHETRHKNIVSKYIPNPLIINGYKCDLRIYVTVTSFDPVVIYMYSEGLTRFATVKYDLTLNDLNDRCMHLTNYSINMENEQYVKNIDSNVENEGSKWSLGALLRYFKSQGKDTAAIMQSIEDVVIKTILSVEWKVGSCCKRYMQHRHNCFELFGFDILLDDKYKPWLIEVNLSPSLGCDTPLDVKVKSNMLCDLLNLVGIRCYDPHMQNLGSCERRTVLTLLRNRLKNSYGHYYYRLCRDACHRAWGLRHSRQRLKTLLDLENNWASYTAPGGKRNKAVDFLATLTHAEVEMIQKVREEDARRFGWVRIFPTSDSWDTYHSFMDFPTTNNLVLHQRLYPERHKVMTAGRSPLAGLVTPSSSVNELFFELTGQRKDKSEKVSKAFIENLQRIRQYETPLTVVPSNKFRHKHVEPTSTQGDSNPSWSESVTTTRDLPGKPCTHRQTDELPVVSSRSCQVNLTTESAATELQELGDQICTSIDKNYSVTELLNNGRLLSHSQARKVFTVYLLRVHRMLLMDYGDGVDQEQVDDLSHLMLLVTHFLKQCVQYMVMPLHLQLSGHFTSVADQRVQLAKILSKFIQLYVEETNSQKAAGDQVSNDRIILKDDQFEQYIYNADVKELERLLTAYSEHHDPVITFLGQHLKGAECKHPSDKRRQVHTVQT